MTFKEFLTQVFSQDFPREWGTGSIQWKGTNVCMDIVCSCGEYCHHDGSFFYIFECPYCHAKFAVGDVVKLIALTPEQVEFTEKHWASPIMPKRERGDEITWWDLTEMEDWELEALLKTAEMNDDERVIVESFVGDDGRLAVYPKAQAEIGAHRECSPEKCVADPDRPKYGTGACLSLCRIHELFPSEFPPKPKP